MSGGGYEYVGGELELFAAARRWKSYFRRHLRPFLGRRVLEVGAGTGGTTALLCDGSADRWLCLEPDARLAGRLRGRVESGGLPACCAVEVGTVADVLAGRVAAGDAGGAGGAGGAGESGPFDTAVYIDVLEHIEDDAAEVARAAEVVAPGGRVVALSPAHPWLFSPFDAAIGHHRRYTRATLAALAPPSLEIERLIYLDSVGLTASAANRLLLRSAHPTVRQVMAWDRLMVPASRLLDPLLRHRVGKSVVAVWRRRG